MVVIGIIQRAALPVKVGAKRAKAGIGHFCKGVAGRIIGVNVGDAVHVALQHQPVAYTLQVHNFAGLRLYLHLPGSRSIVCRTGIEAPLAVSEDGIGIDSAIKPGGVMDLSAAGRGNRCLFFKLVGVQKHHLRPSCRQIFRDGNHIAVGRICRVEIAGTVGQGAYAAGVQVIRANHRIILQLPARVGNDFAPDQSVVVFLYDGAGKALFCEGTDDPLLTGGVYGHQLAVMPQAVFHRHHTAVFHREKRVVDGITVAGVACHLVKCCIGLPHCIFLLPLLSEICHRTAEILAAGAAGVPLVNGVQNAKINSDFGEIAINVAHHVIFGMIPHKGLDDISEGVFVRDKVVVRPEAVGVVAVYPSREEIGLVGHQKVGVAAAAGLGKVGLGMHGIALKLPAGGVEAHSKAHALLSQQGAEYGKGSGGEMGALTHVAAFVHGQLVHPVVGIATVERRGGVDVHTARGPHHRGVAGKGIRMENQRHMCTFKTVCLLHPRPLQFKIVEVGARQGVHPAGIYHVKVFAFDGFPPQAARVCAQRVILRKRPLRERQAQNQRYEYPTGLHP